jgi:putative nucleotidyltransferase with HDIG domain
MLIFSLIFILGNIFFYQVEQNKSAKLFINYLQNLHLKEKNKLDQYLESHKINLELFKNSIDEISNLLPTSGEVMLVSNDLIIYSSKHKSNGKKMNTLDINLKKINFIQQEDLTQNIYFFTELNNKKFMLITKLNEDETFIFLHGDSINNSIFLLIFLILGITTYYLLINKYLLRPIYELSNNICKGKIFRKKIKIRELEELKNNINSKFVENRRLSLLNQKNNKDVIVSFVKIIESRDSYTAGHSLRVSEYCEKIAREMNLKESEIVKLRDSAILHDIGKIHIPDSVLLKPSRLTKQEFEMIKNHVDAGYKILSEIEMYRDLAEIMKFHHEKYDGTGYPNGISGKNIPFLSRIMAVADSFDAMTTNRIYKPKKSLEQAFEELENSKNSHFDPEIVDYAIRAFKNIKLNNNISQLPVTPIEKHKFAYFYQDSLTEVNNTDYLEFFLNLHISDIHLFKIYVFLTKQMSKFNEIQGWKKGDEVLKEIASILKYEFPNENIFRFNGDDFLIISHTPINLQKSIFNKNKYKLDSINIVIKKLEFKQPVSKYDILDKLSNLEQTEGTVNINK